MMTAYVWGMIGEIKWFIIEREENIKQEASVEVVDMEDWTILIPVLRHRRGRDMQKKSISLYFLMKFLSGKAMEKISMIFVYDIPTYKKYFQR